ncbi:hypothetical protein [Streptomyces sp. NPDC058240]|uniref:hypothetical protein n=1 Tax=Streptomyces sp. NPDC058240 TaxID=3346396 RepID=UPI0036EE18B0
MDASEAQSTRHLLERFTADAGRVVSLEALWGDEVVRDIHHRRYGTGPYRTSDAWRIRRGRLARAFVRTGIEHTLASHPGL